MQKLLEAIDTGSAVGYRDLVIILMLLDTGLCISELTGLRMPHVYLEDGLVKVLGKGNRERIVSVGKQVVRHL